MTRSAPTKELLEQQLEDLNDEYTRLEMNFKAQKEKLNAADQRRMTLASLLDEAHATKSDLEKRVELLTQEKNEKLRRLQAETERMTRETDTRVKSLATATKEHEDIEKTMDMRISVVKRKWEEVELKYLQRISELDQELRMIRAKTREVKQRMAVLTKGCVKKPIMPGFPGEFDDDLGNFDVLQILRRFTDRDVAFQNAMFPQAESPFQAQRERIDKMKAELDNLEQHCRALRMLRDELIERQNEGDEENEEERNEPACEEPQEGEKKST